MATFSVATDLFRLRCIPHIEVTADMLILCDGKRFKSPLLECKRQRNDLEILAKEVDASG